MLPILFHVFGVPIYAHGFFLLLGLLCGIGWLVVEADQDPAKAHPLTHARIGHDCIIGAGTLVTGRSVIPPRSMVLGLPGRVVRSLTDEEVQSIRTAAEHYVKYGADYKHGK